MTPQEFQIRDRPIPSTLHRNLSIEAVEDTGAGEIEFSLSSSEPYRRWFAIEILRHTDEAVQLDRINNGSAALLFNHDRDAYIGILTRGWLEGGKLRVKAKFELDNEDNTLARKIYRSVVNGTLKSVSVGYEYNDIEIENRDGEDYVIVTRWTPFEGSIVTVPADPTVGIGRNYEGRCVTSDGIREYLEQEDLETGQICVNVRSVEQKTDFGNSDPSASCPPPSALEKKDTTTMEVEAPTINTEDLLRQERERSSQLLAAGKKYNCPELAQRAIAEGWTIMEMRSHVLDHRQQENTRPVAAALTQTDMSKKERRSYSFLRAIGHAAGRVSADEAGLELEVSRHIESQVGKPPQGIYVDQSFLVESQRDLFTTVPEAAGVLIETELLSDRFIEALYNESAFLPLGVTYLRGLEGNIEIPREGTFQKGYWVEEGAVIPTEDATFNKISLSPKKLAVRAKMTTEMLVQSSIDLENLTRNRLLRGLALELDRSIGFGTGLGEEPLGILYHPETRNIVLGENGGALDWAAVIAMQAEIDQANAMNGGQFSYVVNSRTKAKLMTTLDQGSGSGDWIWQMRNTESSIAGYRARCSNQIPNNLIKGTATNLTAAFFGDFSNVLLGLWTGLDIAIDPFSDFDRAIIGLRAMQLVDLNLTRGDYFCCCSDVANG